MNIAPDDEIYQVDEVFLGPDRFRVPWRWTYRQYGVALVTFLAIQFIERQMGIGFGLWPSAFALLGTIAVARWVQDGVNWDRGLKTMFQELRLELSGPRARKHPIRTVSTVARGRRTDVTSVDDQRSSESGVDRNAVSLTRSDVSEFGHDNDGDQYLGSTGTSQDKYLVPDESGNETTVGVSQ